MSNHKGGPDGRQKEGSQIMTESTSETPVLDLLAAMTADSVAASSLDPGLPEIPLGDWLRQVVGSSAQYEWSSGSCAGQRAGGRVRPTSRFRS